MVIILMVQIVFNVIQNVFYVNLLVNVQLVFKMDIHIIKMINLVIHVKIIVKNVIIEDVQNVIMVIMNLIKHV